MLGALLDAGADVNITDSDENTVLHVAAEEGVPVDSLKEIIKRTKNINQLNDSGDTALHNLVWLYKESKDMLVFLIKIVSCV